MSTFTTNAYLSNYIRCERCYTVGNLRSELLEFVSISGTVDIAAPGHDRCAWTNNPRISKYIQARSGDRWSPGIHDSLLISGGRKYRLFLVSILRSVPVTALN